MAKQSAQEFIQGVFSPMVAVLCSSEAEDLCKKNNLSFVELLQPFCQSVEVTVKPPTGTQAPVAAKLRLAIRDLHNPVPHLAASKKLLNDSVANVQPDLDNRSSLTSIKVGCYSLQVSSSTPWFNSYRDVFFQVMPPLEHDFTRHFLACIFVVASSQPSPQEEIQRLAQSQHHCQLNGSHHSRWFFPHVLKYYVLLHDVAQGDLTKAEALYQSMTNLYGSSCCHLLQVNSVLLEDTYSTLPDLWSPFLSQHIGTKSEVSSRLTSTSTAQDDDLFQQGGQGTTEVGMRSNSGVHHPLLSSGDSPSPTMDMQPLSTSEKRRQPGVLLGACLSQSDRERVTVFLQDFCAHSLVPYAEEQMRLLNDQVTNKKGIHRSFMNVKKLFAGSKTGPQGPHAAVNSVVYSQDAPELQVRRLGDLAFLFQLYEFAYHAYHSAKRDFSSDSAWLHFAGAQEMAALAAFMAGISVQRPFPMRYMDSAIDLYLNTCKLPQLATRAALLSTECLRQLGQHSSVAAQLIRLTSEDSDLRSALLLEQAAYCFLLHQSASSTNPSPLPSVRKYAFHAVLAGHRYSKAGHRKHSLRSYREALQVYHGRNWSLAEDHINFTIGRQSLFLKLLQGAHEAFHCLLSKHSEQSPTQQLLFLREFLLVLKMLREGDNEMAPVLLPLPEVNAVATRVHLGSIASEDFSGHLPTWIKLEEQASAVASGGSPPIAFRPQLNLLDNKTDNSYRPLAVVNEPITVELELQNTLQIPLHLSKAHLLWSFVPCGDSNIISNDITSKSVEEANCIVSTEVVDEILFESGKKNKVLLCLTPRKTGDLHITGFAYRVGLSPNQLDTTSDLSPLPTPVLGQQLLSLRGPKLKNPKQAKNGQLYAPDWRLHPTVVAAMPRLRVSFSHLPTQLLCGEVQRSTLYLSNEKDCPGLSSLLIASPTPELFCLGSGDEEHACTEDSGVSYCEKPLPPGKSAAVLAQRAEVCHVCIPPPQAMKIAGGESVSLPFWIRGPDTSGRHVLRLLFYYEGVGEKSKFMHRVLYYSIHFTTLPSLSLQASAWQSISAGPGSVPDGALVSLQANNDSEVNSVYNVDLSLLQVTCVSKVWSLAALSTHLKPGIATVKPQETKNIVMKVVPFNLKLGQDDTAVVSQLPLTRIQMESARTPCLDFCWRSSAELPLFNQNSPPFPKIVASDESGASDHPISITLAVIWKAAVDRDGQVCVVMGQQHLNLHDFHVIYSSTPGQKVDSRLTVPVYPNIGLIAPTFQYVRCTLMHPAHVKHDFASTRLLLISVNLVVHNPSFRAVTVQAEPAVRTPPPVVAMSPVSTPELVATDVGGFSWATRVRRLSAVRSRDTVALTFTAAFSSPGTYNMASLEVTVFTSEGQKSHEVLCPSLMVVQQQGL
ncbi:trafficking protein particle complex subunit 8-like isoform X2 [Ornithodoros turicata]|uniref:trafficking protein particle complex subunit 8-like isoform X2 n=1 Tax=Ornithodoros turicata TaxID=34597 RepID=UPI003139EAF7